MRVIWRRKKSNLKKWHTSFRWRMQDFSNHLVRLNTTTASSGLSASVFEYSVHISKSYQQTMHWIKSLPYIFSLIICYTWMYVTIWRKRSVLPVYYLDIFSLYFVSKSGFRLLAHHGESPWPVHPYLWRICCLMCWWRDTMNGHQQQSIYFSHWQLLSCVVCTSCWCFSHYYSNWCNHKPDEGLCS